MSDAERARHIAPAPVFPMAKPYQELTPAQMIEIAHRFHPKLNLREYRDSIDFGEFYWKTPERRALIMAQDQAWENMKRFDDFITAVCKALPPHSYCKNHSVPGHNAAYYAMMGLPKTDGVSRGGTLIVHVGFLIPYYAYYEIADERTLEDVVEPHRLYEVSPALKPMAEIVEQEIEKHFGYYRFPPELMKTRLPGLYVEGGDEEPLLFQAIMSRML